MPACKATPRLTVAGHQLPCGVNCIPTGDRMTLQALIDLWPLALALAAVFVAATVSSTVGFAFSVFAAGLLFHIMSNKISK